MKRRTVVLSITGLMMLGSAVIPFGVVQAQESIAAPSDEAISTSASSKQSSANDTPSSKASNTRNFYQVLDELLADFEYDLKTGTVIGLKDLSIRNLATSENVPPSFKSHLELLVSERILKTTKTRIVHCVACRSKRARLSGDSMVIVSTDSNPTDLQRIAKLNGIQNFMDIAFAYQASGMILSLQIYDSDTGTMLWSRSYNSETSRASAKRRGVDYDNLDQENMRMEYQPMVQMRPTLYTILAPKTGSGSSTVLGFGFRMMERYDNRKKEVGFEMNYYYNVNSLISNPNAIASDDVFNGFNLTMLFVHSWGLFGDIENFNQARGSIYGAIGGTYASGFLGALVRVGYEWRFAKHWVVPVFLGYRPTGTVVLPNHTTSTLSGIEGGLGVGYLF